MDRINSLKQIAFEKKGFDGFLIMNAANLLYLTGVPGTACLLIPKKGNSILHVYSVNYEQAKAEAKTPKVEKVKRGEDLMAKVAGQVKALKIKKLAADSLSVESYRSIMKGVKGTAKLKIQGSLVWELRKVKTEDELELMRKAAELTNAGMKAAYETIRPGVKETEVAAEIEYAMRMKDSWGTAFETSVASGARSAYPHGGCMEKQIKKGELVVVDIGAKYHDYCSDMTRTMVAGKPSEKQMKLHEIVKKAQHKAFETIKPKAKAKDVDAAARKTIADAGYGDYFVHGLGHGVGLEVHEPPALSSQSKDRLMPGNVVTNEPGVYLIDYGGVRIEDSVLVKKRGAENLTNGPYTLETER